MKYIILAVASFILFASKAFTQTLFTIGNEAVSVQEFSKAYEKNNVSPKRNAKDIQEYLDLYIASRLKIKEAKDRRFDTLPQVVADLDGLRNQLLPAYLTDKETVDNLVREAFERSQKDIQLQHIFVSFLQNGKLDTSTALKRAKEAYEKLRKGEAFSSVATSYSDDPSVKTNGGNVGFITAFSLPYELESLAYKTLVGKFSEIYRSANGYHIFKKLSDRKAVGKIKVAQILIANPQDASAEQVARSKKLADSIYNRVVKGDDFGNLASEFSNDVISAASNGLIPEFGVGEFDPLFENAVLTIKKDGDVTKAFNTSHGWHIVKRISITPPPSSPTEAVLNMYRDMVLGNERIKLAQDALVSRTFKSANFKKTNYNNNDLWRFTDSLLDYKTFGIKNNITSQTTLFSLDKNNISASEWINFARINRNDESGNGVKNYEQVWQKFLYDTGMEYYKANLEDLNPDFKEQLNEFAEGNLFFEIMQEKVWNPAQTDTIALKKYYNTNKSNYKWKESADVIIFYTGDVATANGLFNKISKDPSKWKSFSDDASERVVTDSTRIELNQIPSSSIQTFKAGTVTNPLVNAADNTASFAYVIKTYPAGAERSFEEAKGLVINDYQSELEKRWVDELKKRYPVKINQSAFASLIK
jgi:peptidyl-prolyl cis-trans isomerase SurA